MQHRALAKNPLGQATLRIALATNLRLGAGKFAMQLQAPLRCRPSRVPTASEHVATVVAALVASPILRHRLACTGIADVLTAIG